MYKILSNLSALLLYSYLILQQVNGSLTEARTSVFLRHLGDPKESATDTDLTTKDGSKGAVSDGADSNAAIGATGGIGPDAAIGATGGFSRDSVTGSRSFSDYDDASYPYDFVAELAKPPPGRNFKSHLDVTKDEMKRNFEEIRERCSAQDVTVQRSGSGKSKIYPSNSVPNPKMTASMVSGFKNFDFEDFGISNVFKKAIGTHLNSGHFASLTNEMKRAFSLSRDNRYSFQCLTNIEMSIAHAGVLHICSRALDDTPLGSTTIIEFDKDLNRKDTGSKIVVYVVAPDDDEGLSLNFVYNTYQGAYASAVTWNKDPTNGRSKIDIIRVCLLKSRKNAYPKGTRMLHIAGAAVLGIGKVFAERDPGTLPDMPKVLLQCSQWSFSESMALIEKGDFGDISAKALSTNWESGLFDEAESYPYDFGKAFEMSQDQLGGYLAVFDRNLGTKVVLLKSKTGTSKIFPDIPASSDARITASVLAGNEFFEFKPFGINGAFTELLKKFNDLNLDLLSAEMRRARTTVKGQGLQCLGNVNQDLITAGVRNICVRLAPTNRRFGSVCIVQFEKELERDGSKIIVYVAGPDNRKRFGLGFNKIITENILESVIEWNKDATKDNPLEIGVLRMCLIGSNAKNSYPKETLPVHISAATIIGIATVLKESVHTDYMPTIELANSQWGFFTAYRLLKNGDFRMTRRDSESSSMSEDDSE